MTVLYYIGNQVGNTGNSDPSRSFWERKDSVSLPFYFIALNFVHHNLVAMKEAKLELRENLISDETSIQDSQ